MAMSAMGEPPAIDHGCFTGLQPSEEDSVFAQVLLAVTGNRGVRRVLTRSKLSRSVVSRFVPGEDVDAAESAVRNLAGAGLRASLDYLGEDITDVAQAAETVESYRQLVTRLADAGLAEGNVDYGVVADFDSADAYRAYAAHPAHRDVIERLIKPIRDRRTGLQFLSPSQP